MYSRIVKIPTTRISSGIITPLSPEHSLLVYVGVGSLRPSSTGRLSTHSPRLLPVPYEAWMQDRANGKIKGFSKRKKELLAPHG